MEDLPSTLHTCHGCKFRFHKMFIITSILPHNTNPATPLQSLFTLMQCLRKTST